MSIFTENNFELAMLGCFSSFGLAVFLGAIIVFFDMPNDFIGMWILPFLGCGMISLAVGFFIDWGLKAQERKEQQRQD